MVHTSHLGSRSSAMELSKLQISRWTPKHSSQVPKIENESQPGEQNADFHFIDGKEEKIALCVCSEAHCGEQNQSFSSRIIPTCFWYALLHSRSLFPFLPSPSSPSSPLLALMPSLLLLSRASSLLISLLRRLHQDVCPWLFLVRFPMFLPLRWPFFLESTCSLL